MVAKVTQEDREKHSVSDDGRFPIATKQQAISALRLRGKAKDKAERLAIIRRAAKYVPEMARQALEDDRKKGLI
jgi:hypothetical protein